MSKQPLWCQPHPHKSSSSSPAFLGIVAILVAVALFWYVWLHYSAVVITIVALFAAAAIVFFIWGHRGRHIRVVNNPLGLPDEEPKKNAVDVVIERLGEFEASFADMRSDVKRIDGRLEQTHQLAKDAMAAWTDNAVHSLDGEIPNN
jgi:hypothetical protein